MEEEYPLAECSLNFDEAWEAEAGCMSGKYICYRKDLRAMEEDASFTFREFLVEGTAKVCFFRGEAGISKFIQEKNLT